VVTQSGNGRAPLEWAFLLHRLPREPSAPRIALWRALRRLGAVLVGDGLVALPADPRSIEHLQWLAADVVEHGGTASVWRARPVAAGDGDRLAELARAAADDEYRGIHAEAAGALASDEPERRRTLRRLRGRLRRIAARDFFGAPGGPAARAAVERLAKEEVRA
jgi:hypothetical protein